MFSRRFVLLAGVLVALNVRLWFAAPGLAPAQALIVTQLFGPSMVRAQVHREERADWNLDRGVITKVNGTQLTLREADGRVAADPARRVRPKSSTGDTASRSEPRSRAAGAWSCCGRRSGPPRRSTSSAFPNISATRA